LHASYCTGARDRRARSETFRSESKSANVRQLLGRPGEVWVPEFGADRLLVFRTR
jgi:virginiamycin B lyase